MTELRCNECERTFKKKIGPNTYEVKCPKCGGYDTELADDGWRYEIAASIIKRLV